MTAPDSPDQEQPFLSHLLELRDRLLRSVVAVFLVFLALFPFANRIYVFVATPLMKQLPEGTSMIATEVAAPFLTPFKLTLVAAVFLAMPYLLYQIWGFVAPGLYKHEKRLITPLVVSSALLFYLGMAFAYFVVFPLVFAFLTSTAPEGVAVMTDMSRYLDFVLTLFFAFGAAFEIPIATILLVWMGVTTPEAMARQRPYVIVGVFVVGMLLTPPDVISQTLLAVPMWLLFEAGVQFSKFFVREDPYAEQAPGPAPGPSPAPAAAGAAAGINTAAGAATADPPRSDADLDAELDAIEAAEDDAEELDALDDEDEDGPDPVEAKLRRVQVLREEGEDLAEVRRLLHEVLAEGDADQQRVARNILEQLDA